MFRTLREDIATVFAKDPAARTVWEVLLAYPGLHALWLHRMAHWLWTHRLNLCGRLLSHVSRFITGVEIHPGARIGRRCFIDHGMGIVIGETAEIGDDVLLYQGVVLGGTSMERVKRHATVGNHVIIGSGAILLGPITIGDDARIGAGSVVIQSVPQGATVVGVPARLAGRKEPVGVAADLDHDRLPDPVVRALNQTLERYAALEERVRALEEGQEDLPPAAEAPRPAPDELGRKIQQALRQVIDPELGVDLVELGLIRQVYVSDGQIQVRMVLTHPNCPFAGYLTEEVRRVLRDLPGVEQVEVRLLDEPWQWPAGELENAQRQESVGKA